MQEPKLFPVKNQHCSKHKETPGAYQTCTISVPSPYIYNRIWYGLDTDLVGSW